MMNNLFSIFDPSTSMMSMAWLVIFISILFIPTKMLKISNTILKMSKKVMSIFKKEVKFSLGKTEKSSEVMIIISFMIILIMNFLALYPQVFSPTTHLTVTLPLSMLFWLSLMMFGWTKNTSHMLAHLVPQGTPVALMTFMVVIELVSNLIRPITLCVRLTANLVSGHLLMSLLGNAMVSMTPMLVMLSLPISMTLTILESAVACIQAYVFMTLVTLYTTEMK